MTTPPSTAERILLTGERVSQGTEGEYRRLRYGPGEGHKPRNELYEGAPWSPRSGGETLARIGHVTDLHIADTQSPLRLDFASPDAREVARWGGPVIHAHHPQELLTAHAAAAMIDTLGRAGIDLGIVTGDAADNAQYNEIQSYLAVARGGTVHPVSAGGVYEGVQDPAWGDERYWRPTGGPDDYKRRWGYPTLPDFLRVASAPFAAPGFGVPWLGCLGNHDLLVSGATRVRAALNEIAVGSHKPTRFSPDLDLSDPIHTLLTAPEGLYRGPGRTVASDPDRRLVTAHEAIEAHLDGGDGHGFTAANLAQGTAYYAYDLSPRVRVITLDTNHPHGHWDGSVDRTQLDWLAEQLALLERPDAPFVILASHHASPSLNNAFGVCPDTAHSTAYASELLRLGLSSSRVILWLNGHHHANRITAHHRPGGGGFFEVTTASIVDSPGQGRVLEIIDHGSAGLEIVSTIYDADVPLTAHATSADFRALAALHREIAANERWRGHGRQGLAGLPTDRNVRMRLPHLPHR